MDEQRFDALMRALGRGSSRRTVLIALRAATFGGIVSLLGSERGDAAQRRKHHARQQSKRRRKDRAKAVHAQVEDDVECAAKVGICHRTRSQKNPFQYIEICVDSVPDHAAHGDLVACPPGQVINPETCECAGSICINSGPDEVDDCMVGQKCCHAAEGGGACCPADKPCCAGGIVLINPDGGGFTSVYAKIGCVESCGAGTCGVRTLCTDVGCVGTEEICVPDGCIPCLVANGGFGCVRNDPGDPFRFVCEPM